MKYLKLYNNLSEVINTTESTPYVGKTIDGEVKYASESVFGKTVDLVDDTEKNYFKPLQIIYESTITKCHSDFPFHENSEFIPLIWDGTINSLNEDYILISKETGQEFTVSELLEDIHKHNMFLPFDNYITRDELITLCRQNMTVEWNGGNFTFSGHYDYNDILCYKCMYYMGPSYTDSLGSTSRYIDCYFTKEQKEMLESMDDMNGFLFDEISIHPNYDNGFISDMHLGRNFDEFSSTALAGLKTLKYVFIAKSTKVLGYGIFANCINLTRIEFGGTVEQWEQIVKDTTWNYNTPATEVICSNGKVNLK